MPEKDGFYLISKVHEIYDDFKIIVCSAFLTRELCEEFKDKGIAVLKKPFKLSELKEIIG